MSVVNKMLNDLDARSASEDEESAEYEVPAERKRIRFMVSFIAVVVLSAASYFTYRAMPEYFHDLYAKVMQQITDEKPVQEQTKTVSVNSALEEMMPTRNSSDPEPEMAEPEQQAPVGSGGGSEQSSMTAAQGSSDMDEMTASVPQSSSSNDEMTEGSSEVIVDGVSAESINEPLSQIAGNELIPLPEEQQPFVQFSDEDEQGAQIAELNSKIAEAMAEDNVSLAIRIYRQILSIDANYHDARKKLAVLHYSNDEIGAASVVLNEGIESDPDRIDFRLMLARLFYREKQLKQAYAVLAQLDPEVQQNIDYYGLKATLAQELELFAESSHIYGRLVIFEPNRAQWWLGLAISLDRLGQREGAIRAYENAADLRQLSASADDFIRQRILDLGG